MGFYVYILECKDKSYYTGHTDNIEKRICEHESGTIGGYTSSRLPIKLAYLAEFETRDEAINAERQIKNWGCRKKQALIEQNWQELSRLSRKKFKQ